jgi:hypothetical protein
VGVWNLKSFLESNGANMPQDGYGTTVAKYVSLFGGYDTPFTLGDSAGTGSGTTAPPPPPAGGGEATISIAAAGEHAEGTGGGAEFAFVVSRTGDSSGAAAVDYYVWSDTADSGDFASPLAGTARFEAGQTQTVIRIVANGDSTVEANEAFKVALSNARGGTLGVREADGVILNDDGGQAAAPQAPADAGGAGAAGLSISNAGHQAEGSEFVFRITRSGDTSQPALVDYYTWSEQADQSDFSGALSGTARFAAGATEAQVRISAVSDGQAEGEEAFHVALSNARGAAISVGQADGWILA